MKCPLIPCTHFLSENLNEKTSEDATMCTFWFAAKSQPQFVQKRNLDLTRLLLRGMGEAFLTPFLTATFRNPTYCLVSASTPFLLLMGPILVLLVSEQLKLTFSASKYSGNVVFWLL